MKSNAFFHGFSKTKFIVYCGLLLAVSIIIKLIFEIYIPLGGFPTLRLNLTAVPIYLAGLIFGPWAGFIVGFFSDVLCNLIKPAGPFIPTLAITSGLIGLIPGVMLPLLKKLKIRRYYLLNAVTVIAACVVFFLFRSFSFADGQFQFGGEPVHIALLILVGVMMLAFIIVPVVLFIRQKKQSDDALLIPADELYFIVSVTQLITSIIANTIFLAIAYGLTIEVLLPGRIITNFFLIPVYALILAALFRFLPKNLIVQNK